MQGLAWSWKGIGSVIVIGVDDESEISMGILMRLKFPNKSIFLLFLFF